MREKDWRRIFVLRLGVQLRRNNMTQRELAKRIGVTPSAVSHFLSGERRPDITTIVNMAHAFNCTVADLVDVGEEITDR